MTRAREPRGRPSSAARSAPVDQAEVDRHGAAVEGERAHGQRPPGSRVPRHPGVEAGPGGLGGDGGAARPLPPRRLERQELAERPSRSPRPSSRRSATAPSLAEPPRPPPEVRAELGGEARLHRLAPQRQVRSLERLPAAGEVAIGAGERLEEGRGGAVAREVPEQQHVPAQPVAQVGPERRHRSGGVRAERPLHPAGVVVGGRDQPDRPVVAHLEQRREAGRRAVRAARRQHAQAPLRRERVEPGGNPLVADEGEVDRAPLEQRVPLVAERVERGPPLERLDAVGEPARGRASRGGRDRLLAWSGSCALGCAGARGRAARGRASGRRAVRSPLASRSAENGTTPSASTPPGPPHELWPRAVTRREPPRAARRDARAPRRARRRGGAAPRGRGPPRRTRRSRRAA